MKILRRRNSGRFLKAFVIAAAMCFAAQLSGCTSFADQILPHSLLVPETVEVEGETYRTGFYGEDLWPVHLDCTDEEYKINGTNFHRVTVGEFDCLHASIGEKSEGVLYCLDSEWEQAREHYTNPENFDYYCEISPDRITETERAEIHQIDEMDPEMFQKLVNRAEGVRNNPFDLVERALGEKLEADPIYKPDLPDFYYLTFYLQSDDGYFVTYKGDKFSLINGKLYFLRYYDGKDKLLHVIEVPEEIAGYFIHLLDGLDSDYLP